MKGCPSCGCEISAASRFCPMCGAVLNHDAQEAYSPSDEPLPAHEIPVPDDELPPAFEALNNCGKPMISAMRVLTTVISILAALAGISVGVYHIISNNILVALCWIFGGLGVGFLTFFILCILIIKYENVSFIARNTEAQNRLALSQLELLRQLADQQSENLRLSREIAALLRTMDGDRFDANKLTEQQNALLEQLLKGQNDNAQRLVRLNDSGEQMRKVVVPYAQKAQTMRGSIELLARECLDAVALLPDRLRGLFSRGVDESADENVVTDETGKAVEETAGSDRHDEAD